MVSFIKSYWMRLLSMQKVVAVGDKGVLENAAESIEILDTKRE